MMEICYNGGRVGFRAESGCPKNACLDTDNHSLFAIGEPVECTYPIEPDRQAISVPMTDGDWIALRDGLIRNIAARDDATKIDKALCAIIEL